MVKSIINIQEAIAKASAAKRSKKKEKEAIIDPQLRIIELEVLMQEAAENLDFERAIALRSGWMELKKKL